MIRVQATAVGRVLRSSLQSPESGRQFASFSIELSPRSWNDKQFSQRIEVRQYHNPHEALDELNEGDLVSVSGDADTDCYEWNGKTRAKILIFGLVKKVGPFPEFPSNSKPSQQSGGDS